MSKSKVTRRDVLKGAMFGGAAIAMPSIVPASVFGQNAPSNRIRVGCVGLGRMGTGDMYDLINSKFEIVSLCDVDHKRMANAKSRAEDMQKKEGIKLYEDHHELIDSPDIDVVSIVTPDFAHAEPAIYAAKAGKDIFLQKPLTYTIPEGQALAGAVVRNKVVFQTGSQQRSDPRFRKACELVRNGRIGKVHTVEVGVGLDVPCGIEPEMEIPETLDYNGWLMNAPKLPYTEKRVHPQANFGRPGWLRIQDYTHGQVTGWGSHHIDITHWGLGEELAGPLTIEGHATYPNPKESLHDVHMAFHITYTYPNDVTVKFSDNKTYDQGVTFIGTEGTIKVRRGSITADPPSILDSEIGELETHLYVSTNHKQNFMDCIKSRELTITPVEVGHRSNSACVLGSVSMKLDRKIQWDPKAEKIVGDAEAAALVARADRGVPV
jgi:predicted dehydrogenase